MSSLSVANKYERGVFKARSLRLIEIEATRKVKSWDTEYQHFALVQKNQSELTRM